MQSEPGSPSVRARALESRREIVERAETYIRDHADARVPLSSLCRIVGRSERGLRDAFYSVRGMSPTRCMLDQRLRGVRQALTNPSGGPITVTHAATGHGFYELGRFAAVYREAFGEPPSETLRRTSQRLSAQHTSDTKGARPCLPKQAM